MTFGFIAAEKAHYPVTRLCAALGVSTSGYYAWTQRGPSARALADRRLQVHVRAIHRASRGTYGSPRIQAAARTHGLHAGRNRIRRLMRLEGLRGVPRRRFYVTTVTDAQAATAPNRLGQRFTVATPNTVWASDVTGIPTRDGWLYLAVQLDLFSRAVVGWAVGPTLTAALVSDAWDRAVLRRGTAPRLHHSDRGTAYTSAQFQARLRAHRVTVSMSRRGNCYDNAVVESFFRTLKTDLRIRPRWASRAEARAALTDYLEHFYNRQRLHSTLGYRTPAAFEAEARPAV